MKKVKIILVGLLVFICISQAQTSGKIRDIKWSRENDILVIMENDSGFILNVNELFHSDVKQQLSENMLYKHYPVVFGENFIQQLKYKNIAIDTSGSEKSFYGEKYTTLWSAVHSVLGGGWIHFVNCLLYSLESGQLQLTAPLLTRPESNWKPKPLTESYKRTRKWKYYVPIDQKNAIKEYKIREKEDQLGDLKNIPADYIKLFLETSEKEYQTLQQNQEFKMIARIDLVKLLLGANYLDIPQIHYIKSMVLKSMLQYSIKNPVPSIIVFDDLNAAVNMKLDDYGYHLEKIAFKNEERLSEQEYDEKMKMLNTIVSGINEINKRLFEKRLGKYYQ